jgi:LysR family hydrogen peroxide-inducible transcriptional activator
MKPTEITLKQLRYLVAVAEHAHFRRAAEFCRVSQPSLSVQIQNLEAALGTSLVERTQGGVILTPVGREILARAQRVLLDAQAIKDYAATAEHGLAGTIRLGVKATLGPYLLPRIVAALHRKHPETKLYIREGVPSQLEEELKAGVHDVILAQLPVHSADLITQRLFREPILFAMSSDHPLAGKQGLSVYDLKDQPVLSLAPDYHLHDQVHALCEEFGAHVVRDYEGTSLDALRQMVSMNMGATFLPALYAQSEVSSLGDVVITPLAKRRISRSIGLVWRKGAGRSNAYSDLANFIRDVVSSEFESLTPE